METPVEPQKKVALEDLPKQELLEKYKSLLQIAQKAKSAKDTLVQENNALKKQLADQNNRSNTVNEELIENLTQQKLGLVTTIEELKNEKNVALDKLKQYQINLSNSETKISELDTQNQGFQRQVQRLTDENEALISNLDDLEKQIDELKKGDLNHCEQFAALDKNNKKLLEANSQLSEQLSANSAREEKLQCALDKSKEDIIKLEKENIELNQKLETVTAALKENKAEREAIEELKEKAKAIELLHQDLEKLRQNNQHVLLDNEKLTADYKKLEKENLFIQKKNEELMDTMNELKKTIHEYETAVVELNKKNKDKEKQIEDFLNSTDDLNTELHKNRALIDKLQRDLSTTSSKLANNQIVSSGITSDLQNTNEKLKEKLKTYHAKIVKFAKDIKTIQETKIVLLNDFKNYTREVQSWHQQLDSFTQTFTEKSNQLKKEKLELLKENKILEETLRNLKENNQNLLEDNQKLKKDIENFKIKAANSENEMENLNHENQKLKESRDHLLVEIGDLKNKINELQINYDSDNAELLELRSRVIQENKTFSSEIEDVVKQKEALAEESIKMQSQITELQCTIENNQKIVGYLERDKKNLETELETLRNSQIKLVEQSNHAENFSEENKKLKENINSLLHEIDDLKNKIDKIQNEHDSLTENNKILSEQHSSLVEENKKLISQIEASDKEKELQRVKVINMEKQIQELHGVIEDNSREVNSLKQTKENLKRELETLRNAEIGLAEQSRKEIVKLNEEIKELTMKNDELQEKLAEINRVKSLSSLNTKETQTDKELNKENELEETVGILRRDHDELLSEMNVMNQELKERGETISKQQEYCEELLRKIKIFESQTNKSNEMLQLKEDTIRKLNLELESLKRNSSEELNTKSVESHSSLAQKDEDIKRLNLLVEELRHKLNSSQAQVLETSQDTNYAESENMSTSTMSKTEEINRLKDLEGSWEEKYGKLRSLAVKLKGKVRGLTAELNKEQQEKSDVQQKYTNSVKTVQTVQAQCDKLEDELDSNKAEIKALTRKLESAALEISNNKRQLASNDELIAKLKSDIDNLHKEKVNLDNWKRQVSSKVQTLKKEIEANAVLKKEFDSQISKLKADLEAKERELKEEIERHNQTRASLQESNNECKKRSVLNLEMQDYERSLKELSQKLEKKQDLITKLKDQIDSQKSTVNALKEQKRILEEQFQNEQSDLEDARNKIGAYQKSISNLEALLSTKDEKVSDLTSSIENLRLQNEELSTELSKVIAEHQKANSTLKSEKEYLRSQNLGLEQRLREVQEALHLREEELKVMGAEYQNYKVRAQSVLRQNQTRDVAYEEKLSEELASFKAQIGVLIEQLEELRIGSNELKEENAKITSEKEKTELRCTLLENEIQEQKKQFEELSAKHQKTVTEHSETVRSLKIHSETLAQCYRQQLTEQEVRHNKEIIELQSKLEKGSTPPEALPIIPLTPREEGEGSENVDSPNIPSAYPVPLERLLSSESDQEVALIKKQLAENEARVSHLTALLADTEQDLSKHVQMNKLLKEEIRRQQRSMEREKHAENLEYLKNVVFKFVTLNSGDERSRLVPVLNTILKFSREETQKLNEVARGEPGIRGWTNYLPMWSSSSSRPQ